MTKLVYVMHHVREVDGEESVKFLGVFSSESNAEKAVEKYRRLPGFSYFPEGFSIDPYTLDRMEWAEGFIISDETI